jgi:pimeloyl-ACP methyl ester carboxylesterase
MANRYKELIPNHQIILLPAAIGHWPQLEAPEEVLQAFSQFYQRLHTNS